MYFGKFTTFFKNSQISYTIFIIFLHFFYTISLLDKKYYYHRQKINYITVEQ